MEQQYTLSHKLTLKAKEEEKGQNLRWSPKEGWREELIQVPNAGGGICDGEKEKDHLGPNDFCRTGLDPMKDQVGGGGGNEPPHSRKNAA